MTRRVVPHLSRLTPYMASPSRNYAVAHQSGWNNDGITFPPLSALLFFALRVERSTDRSLPPRTRDRADAMSANPDHRRSASTLREAGRGGGGGVRGRKRLTETLLKLRPIARYLFRVSARSGSTYRKGVGGRVRARGGKWQIRRRRRRRQRRRIP